MKQEQNSEKSISVMGFFWRHGHGQRRWMALAFAALIVSIGASFLMPQVVRFTVDSIVGDGAGQNAFLGGLLQSIGGREALRQNLLLWAAVAVVVFAALAGVFNFVSRMAVATGTERFCKNLRDTLYRHVQYLPFSWQVQNQTGDIIQRCTSDLEVVRNFAAQQLLEVIRTVVIVAVALGLMFSMNIKLALVALAFVPAVGLYSIIFYRIVGQRFLAADKAEGELTVNVQENLTGVRVVRAFGRESFELERFDKYNNGFAKLWIKLGHTLSVYWGTGDFATSLQVLTVIVVGAVMAANGEISLGEFLVFVSYNQSLAWPVRALGRVLAEMSKTGVSAARIQEILDAKEEQPEPAAQKPNLRQDIHFEDVTFAYNKDAPVLQNLTFTIKRGSTFGIMGATGSGKSTITYLLNRLYDLPEGFGSIKFGDTDVRNIDRYYLRRNVGLVLQEPFLFSKTIGENIAIAAGDKMADSGRICAAAGVAAVDHAIQAFTKGYDTVVGERGVTLSGGQKQRVAIARTLMLNAPVMVFDDSMSAVDLETDARIRAALKNDVQDATVLLISHRINTLMAADTILVLEGGNVADMGTHKELISRPGLYRRIYDMQSEAAADAGERLEDLAQVRGAKPLEGGVAP